VDVVVAQHPGDSIISCREQLLGNE
jgi:hypothetical protein